MAYSVPTSTPDVTVNPDNTLLAAFVNAQKQKNQTLAQQLMQEGSAVSPVYSTAQGMARLGMAGLGGLYGYLDQQGNAKQQAAILNNIRSMQGQGGSALPGGFSTAPPKDDDEDGTPGKQASAAPINNPELASAIKTKASELGIDPVHLATAMSYETGGTFTTDRTPNGRIGLIQAGPEEARQYGFAPGQSYKDQLDATGRYLTDRGLKPGMGMMDLYSTINAGRPGLYDRSDAMNGGAPGTVADKVNNQMGAHRQKAIGLLGSAPQADAGDVALPAGVGTEYASLPGGSSNPIDAAVGPGSANAVDAVRQAGSSVSSAPVPPERPAGLGGSPAISPSPGPKALASALSQYNVNPNAADAGAKAFAADPSNRGPQYGALLGKPLTPPQAAPQAASQPPAQYASLPTAAPTGGVPQAPAPIGGAPRASDAAPQPPPKPAGTQVAQASDGGQRTALQWTAIAQQAANQGNDKLAEYAMGMAKRAQDQYRIVYDKDGNSYNLAANGQMTKLKDAKGNTQVLVDPRTQQPYVVDKDDPTKTKPVPFPQGEPAYRSVTDPAERAKLGVPSDYKGIVQIDQKGEAHFPGKSNVEVNFGDKANTQLDKNIIDDIQLSKQKAMGSVGTLTAINRQKEAIDKGIITGWGADWQTQARGAAAKLLGIEDVPLTKSQEFDAAANQKGSELAKQISNAGHTTNADLQIGKIIAGGDRTKTEAAIKAIVDAQEKLAVKQIELHNKSVDKFAKVVPDAATRADWYRVETPEIYQYGQNKAEGAASPKRLRYNPATGALE